MRRARAGPALFAAVVCAASGVVSTARANFAPLARASAMPTEALVGQPIVLSGARSVDPDSGPSPLSFRWTLGDGAESTDPEVTHAYDTPGVYAVSLTVSDGLASSVAVVEVAVLAPPIAGTPAASSMLLLDGDRLFVANPDSATITVLDTSAGLRVVREVGVGADPRSVALSADRARVFVACRGAGELWTLDAGSLEPIARTRTGHEPSGVVVVPGDGRILVANEGDDTVLALSPDGTRALSKLEVSDAPHAIAVTQDGARALVTHFLTRGPVGSVTVIDTRAMTVERVVALAEDPGPDTPSSGRGFPNLLSAIGIDPAGRFAWVGGLKSNTGRGMHVSGELLVPRNRLRGVMARIRLESLDEEVPRRIDTNDADSVSAIAFSPRGRYAFVTHQGAGTLSIYDLLEAELHDSSDGDTVPFEARLEVGDAPRGLAVSPEGDRVYVASFLSREVVAIDVTAPAAPSIVARVAVTAEPLDPHVANGKRMFHRSAEPRHSEGNYIACASCHPEGGIDGRTWDFTQSGEGLRNTIDLRGHGGMAHGPVHWSANFDEIQDFENDIVNAFGGTGLAEDGAPPNAPLGELSNAGRSADLDDLAAYVSSLVDGHRSPWRALDGSLPEAAARGKRIFEDPRAGCTGCHAPPRYTDSVLTGDRGAFVLHDVGTIGEASGQRLGGPLPGLDTPSLIGAWDTAPYLHDGSAPTLRDVLTARNAGDRHGTTSSLSPAEIDDLVAYLRCIDGTPDEPRVDADAGVLIDRDAGAAEPIAPATASGCACSVRARAATASRAWLAIALAAIVGRSRRKRC